VMLEAMGGGFTWGPACCGSDPGTDAGKCVKIEAKCAILAKDRIVFRR
jgi:hypothetical protein